MIPTTPQPGHRCRCLPVVLGILTPRRSLPLIAAAAIGWWLWSPATPTASVTPPPPPALHVMPLSGDPLADAIHAPGPGGCLEFIDTLVTQPHWRLGVVEASSGCLGETEHATYDIDFDGTVRWTEAGLTRNVTLTAAEMAIVRGLNRLDCTRTEEVGYGEGFFRVSYGDAGNGGGHISGSSAMGMTLRWLLDGAIERTAAHRVASLGQIRFELDGRSFEDSRRWTRRNARYHLTVDDLELTVRRGRRVLVRRALTERELLDVVDWAYQTAVADQPSSYDADWSLARGQLRIADRSPIAVTIFPMERGPAQLLGRAFDEAAYAAEYRAN